MALPQTPEQWEHLNKAFIAWVEQRNLEVKELLSQWVSGLEPELIYDYSGFDLQLVGAGVFGDPASTVVVANPYYRKRSPGLLGIVASASGIPKRYGYFKVVVGEEGER